uniref:Uncharacterized protein n=1 Tax=Anopheles melas TaxID=34690 RepID=A0A182TRG5_9DIPT
MSRQGRDMHSTTGGGDRGGSRDNTGMVSDRGSWGMRSGQDGSVRGGQISAMVSVRWVGGMDGCRWPRSNWVSGRKSSVWPAPRKHTSLRDDGKGKNNGNNGDL